VIAEGQHVLIVSPTGTGKTLAFGIPLVQRLALRYLVKPLKLRSVTFDEAERLKLQASRPR
jgi:superfamily II DNA/RNA helicase